MCDSIDFRSEWPSPYDSAFDHLQKKEDAFVDNEDAYYTTDLENEDGEINCNIYHFLYFTWMSE